jgi:hypothetical protein
MNFCEQFQCLYGTECISEVEPNCQPYTCGDGFTCCGTAVTALRCWGCIRTPESERLARLGDSQQTHRWTPQAGGAGGWYVCG